MALCLCDASKKLAKERTLDMEAAAEKMIFFEEATGVLTEKQSNSVPTWTMVQVCVLLNGVDNNKNKVQINEYRIHCS